MPRPSLYCSAVPDTHGTAAKPGGECGRVLHYFCSCCLPSRLYCRHRNFTGSAAPCLLAAGAVRGLSPPVRNFTDPGARLNASIIAHLNTGILTVPARSRVPCERGHGGVRIRLLAGNAFAIQLLLRIFGYAHCDRGGPHRLGGGFDGDGVFLTGLPGHRNPKIGDEVRIKGQLFCPELVHYVTVSLHPQLGGDFKGREGRRQIRVAFLASSPAEPRNFHGLPGYHHCGHPHRGFL